MVTATCFAVSAFLRGISPDPAKQSSAETRPGPAPGIRSTPSPGEHPAGRAI